MANSVLGQTDRTEGARGEGEPPGPPLPTAQHRGCPVESSPGDPSQHRRADSMVASAELRGAPPLKSQETQREASH